MDHLSDLEFLERLYPEKYKDVYKLIAYKLYHGTRMSTDTADLTQEVFILAAIKIDELRSHPQPINWLYKTAHNLSRNHISMRARHKEQLFGDLSLHGGETEPTKQSDVLISLEQTLSKEDYALLKAYYIDERPIDEISSAYGMTPNALRVRIHRIRKYLSTFFSFLVIFARTYNI